MAGVQRWLGGDAVIFWQIPSAGFVAPGAAPATILRAFDDDARRAHDAVPSLPGFSEMEQNGSSFAEMTLELKEALAAARSLTAAGVPVVVATLEENATDIQLRGWDRVGTGAVHVLYASMTADELFGPEAGTPATAPSAPPPRPVADRYRAVAMGARRG
ncbi:hypothetical protein GAY33_36370, partial [Azospirillum brasilense]|uniref:hypothetical protein n=1 Tax=Azospirillum argentinense TaxID=2970906 RepID=UPI00190ED647